MIVSNNYDPSYYINQYYIIINKQQLNFTSGRLYSRLAVNTIRLTSVKMLQGGANTNVFYLYIIVCELSITRYAVLYKHSFTVWIRNGLLLYPAIGFRRWPFWTLLPRSYQQILPATEANDRWLAQQAVRSVGIVLCLASMVKQHQLQIYIESMAMITVIPGKIMPLSRIRIKHADSLDQETFGYFPPDTGMNSSHQQ